MPAGSTRLASEVHRKADDDRTTFGSAPRSSDRQQQGFLMPMESPTSRYTAELGAIFSNRGIPKTVRLTPPPPGIRSLRDRAPASKRSRLARKPGRPTVHPDAESSAAENQEGRLPVAAVHDDPRPRQSPSCGHNEVRFHSSCIRRHSRTTQQPHSGEDEIYPGSCIFLHSRSRRSSPAGP